MTNNKICFEEIYQLIKIENSDIESISGGDSDLDCDHVSIDSHHSDSESELTIKNEEIEEPSNDIPDINDTHPITKDSSVWFCSNQFFGITPAHNIIRDSLNKVTLPPKTKIKKPAEAFNLIFSKDLISLIVKFTNIEAIRCYSKKDSKKSWKPVDEIEIQAFIGLLLTAGHLKYSDMNLDRLWSIKYGPLIFRATMSEIRFREIMRFVRFSDKTQLHKQETDKLACIRNVWEKVNENLGKYYKPGSNITVGEQIFPFNGKCPFKVLTPNTSQMGIKIFWVNDSENGYPFGGIPYLGKDENMPKSIHRENMAKILTAPYYHTNRNVTCNNLFASKRLALSLKNSGLTMIGTLKKNKPYIPNNFQYHHSRKIFSSIFGFTRLLTLVSYVPKKNKTEILLSTMHHSNEITQNKKKPLILIDYNKTKGGTEYMNRTTQMYSCKRKTNRWEMAFFMNLLDVAGFAANIIYKKTNEDTLSVKFDHARYMFLEELGEDLISNQIQRRLLDAKSKSVKHKILTFGVRNDWIKSEPTYPPIKKSRGKCHLCETTRKIFQHCVRCYKNTCNAHSALVCNCCLNNN